MMALKKGLCLSLFMVSNVQGSSNTAGFPCEKQSSLCIVSECPAPPVGCIRKETPSLVFNTNGECCPLDLCEFVFQKDASVGCGFQKPLSLPKQKLFNQKRDRMAASGERGSGIEDMTDEGSQVGRVCEEKFGNCPEMLCLNPPSGCITDPHVPLVITRHGFCCPMTQCTFVNSDDLSPCAITTTMVPKGNLPQRGSFSAGKSCIVQAGVCPMARCAPPPEGCVTNPAPPLIYEMDGSCCPEMCALVSESDPTKPCNTDETKPSDGPIDETTDLLTPPIPYKRKGGVFSTQSVDDGLENEISMTDDVKPAQNNQAGTVAVVVLLVVLFAVLSVMATIYQKKKSARAKRSLLENVRSSVGTSVVDDSSVDEEIEPKAQMYKDPSSDVKLKSGPSETCA